MSLENIREKEIQKKEREKGGASRPRPRFSTAGRSWPSPPARLSPPRARARIHARRPAAPCRRGEPAELCRRVARMRRGGHALVGHQEPGSCSPPPPLPFALVHSPSLALSPLLGACKAPPHMWPARHCAFLHRLASASCSPLHCEAPEPLQSRSTGPAPRVDGEQRHRSAMAGGELAPGHGG